MENYPVKFIGQVGGFGDFGVQRGFLPVLRIEPGIYNAMYSSMSSTCDAYLS